MRRRVIFLVTRAPQTWSHPCPMAGRVGVARRASTGLARKIWRLSLLRLASSRLTYTWSAFRTPIPFTGSMSKGFRTHLFIFKEQSLNMRLLQARVIRQDKAHAGGLRLRTTGGAAGDGFHILVPVKGAYNAVVLAANINAHPGCELAIRKRKVTLCEGKCSSVLGPRSSYAVSGTRN